LRILLIDNHDSFTYNLFHMLALATGRDPLVVLNDDVATWREINPESFGGIVISPGPGRPERGRDFGLSRRALEHTGAPLLGVCLGFQGLCLAEAGEIVHAPEPRHGRLSAVHHNGDALFDGIPNPFNAVRYHSLMAHGLPAALPATAWTEDGIPMAVRHRELPRWGVQFHPESICTEHGQQLLNNFVELAGQYRRSVVRVPATTRTTCARPAGTNIRPAAASTLARNHYQLRVIPVPGMLDTKSTFEELFAGRPGAFWLDSSSVVPGLSRFSILGCADGPLGETISYDVRRKEIRVRGSQTEQTICGTTLFDYVEEQVSRRRVPDHGFPFDFALGYVGYLGYELKADCGSPNAHTADTPDAALTFCDRGLVVDHQTNQVWLLALTTPEIDESTTCWLYETKRMLVGLPQHTNGFAAEIPEVTAPPGLKPRHSAEEYRKLINACLDKIRDGESYEICLTNMLSTVLRVDPVRTYRALRRTNPAPYAALLQFDGISVLSSSPERFLTVDRNGQVESKPIKGTRARGETRLQDELLAQDLRSDEKERAENLMIVDLVRNDLSRTAEVGSVWVSKLFDVESYPTVHQMVSTVRSRLAPGVSGVACVRAAFPGGSMTGAPKMRTMEIIDELEDGARGVYSGALGYFSLNGAIDLSIVIRTIVIHGEDVSIGVGGAIVAQSNPDDEIEETRVKARATVSALCAQLDLVAGHRCHD
jgi:para-aminobenzoate synthetase